MNKITHFSTTTQAAIVELFGAECLETGEVSATLEVEGERRGFYGSLEWFEKLIKKNGGGDPLTALQKSTRMSFGSLSFESPVRLITICTLSCSTAASGPGSANASKVLAASIRCFGEFFSLRSRFESTSGAFVTSCCERSRL